MYLKKLTILSDKKVIRDIKFRKGINLIVDETKGQITTGNNVGKTTVLKLIDFCLGADAKDIYIDPETKRDEYVLVKNFLIENKVLIRLLLTEDLDKESASSISIERNFLPRKENIRRVNGADLTMDEFEAKLSKLIFPEHEAIKPSFRQIISHNIRYKDESINNTLRTLDKFTTDVEYEALYLFMLGCKFDNGNTRQEILYKINEENNFKKRLEKKQTRTAYETALSLVENEIEKLSLKRSDLNFNKDFETNLDELNNTKYQINKISSGISLLEIKRDLILEAKEDLESNKTDVDLKQLEQIYKQATDQITGIQKTFVELVNYHNQMTEEKVKFITKGLPEIEKEINDRKDKLKVLLQKEEILSREITKTDSYAELEDTVSQLNEQFRIKGEYEKVIEQLKEIENTIDSYNRGLKVISKDLFSEDFEKNLQNQLNKFNKHFSAISEKLYGEKYAVKYDIVINKNEQRIYKFSSFNTNLSSGKKQGEISCFDIAYILFARDEKISTLHFLLNDKKELVHDNQLVKIADLVNDKDIQFVASILRDKLPNELNNDDFFVVKLSQKDKLFRIENEQDWLSSTKAN